MTFEINPFECLLFLFIYLFIFIVIIFFFQESLVNTMSKEYQNAEDVNILLVHPGQTILSKCFNHITKVYSFKKNIYPKVTQSVSTTFYKIRFVIVSSIYTSK